jgi:CRISPR-associated protein Cas2
MATRWLVSFDIGNSRRRRRACKLLLAHGERIQESVFDLTLGQQRWDRLERDMSRLVDPGRDHWRAWRLCRDDSGDVIELGVPAPEAGRTLVVV